MTSIRGRKKLMRPEYRIHGWWLQSAGARKELEIK
jgi:hypothetical protein